MRALLIKMSSMGDILHTFPALTDLRRHRPDVELHWVVEKGFADMAAWHPAVERVIPITQRQWLRQRDRASWRAWKAWRQDLRRERYDLVLDAQGLLKSGLIARQAHAAERHGFGGRSLREKPAALFHGRSHDVLRSDEAPRELHAVEQNRRLFSQVFHYALSGEPEFGVRQRFVDCRADSRSAPVILIPGTTWHTKHWVPAHWVTLARQLLDDGFAVEIIWGSPEEQAMARQIQAEAGAVEVADGRLSIPEVTQRLARARAVIGPDTGFTHIAGALGTPSIALYGPTAPDQVGLIGRHTRNLTLNLDCAPCHKRDCKWLEQGSTAPPPCMRDLTAEQVYRTLKNLL